MIVNRDSMVASVRVSKNGTTEVVVENDLFTSRDALLMNYSENEDIARSINIARHIIKGTVRNDWDTAPLAPFANTERYRVEVPDELRNTFLSHAQYALAQRGILYSTTDKLWQFQAPDHLMVGSRTGPDPRIFTGHSPLYLQLREGDTTYCLDKTTSGFDQKIFQGETESWHKESPHHDVKKVEIDEHTTMTVVPIDSEHIIKKEQAERSLGMYEPSVEVLTKILRALEKARSS